MTSTEEISKHQATCVVCQDPIDEAVVEKAVEEMTEMMNEGRPAQEVAAIGIQALVCPKCKGKEE